MTDAKFTWSDDDLVFDDVTEDEFNPNQPRAPKGVDIGGQWVSKYEAMTSGTASERVAMRKQLDSETDPEKRKELQRKIVGSFSKQWKKAKAKGDLTKAGELENKLAKYSKQYGLSNPAKVDTFKEANAGFTAAQQAAAKEIMKTVMPAVGTTFTPEETKHFNTLTALGGAQQAKHWSSTAKKRLPNAPAGMTVGELSHVVAYSENAYEKANKELWAGVMDESTWAYANELDGALEKFPKYVGASYRRVRPGAMSQETFNLYQPGKVVTERGFMSSSKSSNRVENLPPGAFGYVVSGKTGRSIERVSTYPNEREILFKSGTRFRVTGKQGRVVHMEEL